MNNTTLAQSVLLLLTCALAAADGGFFYEVTGATVQSSHQRAVIVFEDGRETLILQTRYAGEQADFAWVIPTPTLVQRADFTTADPRVFDQLFYLTEPTGTLIGAKDDGVGCACGGGQSGGDVGRDGSGVNVWDEFSVDEYQVLVLSAEDSADLAGWLTARDYHLPDGAGPVLQSYQARNWHFVAVRLTAARSPVAAGAPASAAASAPELKPLAISFDTDTPVFPLHISSLSSSRTEETSVLLYVIAPRRVEVANYRTTEISTKGWTGDYFPRFYEGRFRQAIGSPPGFAVEYVGRSDGSRPWSEYLRNMLPIGADRTYFVTRLRTYMLPGDMSRDVELAYAANDREFDPSVRYVADAGPRNLRLAAAGVLFLGAMFAGAWGGRPRRRWERAALLMLALVLVL